MSVIAHVDHGEEDRISSLPNEILGQILSFLPTKYAVGTCILSTRWKDLWTSLLSLDFDDELLLRTERPNSDSTRRITLRFTNFVDRVLSLLNVLYVERFRLKCIQKHKSSHVYAWIFIALSRKVRELDLRISIRDSRVLPRHLFTCGTLVSLKLSANFVLNVPASVGLPKLKTLHLESIEFTNDNKMHLLFASCPVLEELLIVECVFYSIRIFNISALALKRLTMDSGFLVKYKYKIVTDAPRLEYLKFIDYVAEDHLVKNLDSLIEAYVRVSGQPTDVFDLILGISNVKVLHLFGDSMEAVQLSPYNLPVFHNVTHLELGVDVEKGWQLLPSLLQNTPNLESLFFREGLEPLRDGKFQWTPPESVTRCLLFSLKRIKIWEFQGRREELKLVEYFLENAKVLHELQISTSSYMAKEQELELNKKLLTFPRRSETCKVILQRRSFGDILYF
ncbi:hypothetical protein L1049_000615 [Liquidambar formosana]|uniref:F-box domain-containing protein n=1 Tax=Liquidambar formosana TaxID=63359 RepID=A0AAP0NBA9_LIQFO